MRCPIRINQLVPLIRTVGLGLGCAAEGFGQAQAADLVPVPSAAMIDEVARLLPAQPSGVGRPISDRPAWTAAAQQPAFQRARRDAEQYATEPTPELTDELFREVLTTGSRVTYERPFRLRTARLCAFVVAEGIENRGRYLPLIERELKAILEERSWGAPAHVLIDHPFGGPERAIDLAVAARAWTVATVDYWLGDQLSLDTRRWIRAELHRRVFDDYESSVRSGHPAWDWMTAESNWNAVCNSGVVGAALTLLPESRERAMFVLGAKHYLSYYLREFPEDGFDDEGLGYWNYGFGSYLCLAETVYQATQGRINWYAGAKLRQIALFPRHFEIVNGVFPAFGDSGVAQVHGLGKVAGTALLKLIDARWGMRWTDLDEGDNDLYSTHPLGDRLYGFGLLGFPLPVYGSTPAAGDAGAADEIGRDPLRFYFKANSVLIARTARTTGPQLGLALKGGRGGSGHGHNDNGTYVVAFNGESLVVDPGMETYTAKSFGPHRYESMMMNSYGHDVPFVGHALQRGGAEAAGEIIATEFSASCDRVVMDLTSSYAVPGLRKILRTFIFDRRRPAVEIVDEAEFDRPTDFGTALISLGSWQEQGPGRFLIYRGRAAVQATVTSESGAVTNRLEPVVGFALPPGTRPERLGVNLAEPSRRAVLRTVITPASGPK